MADRAEQAAAPPCLLSFQNSGGGAVLQVSTLLSGGQEVGPPCFFPSGLSTASGLSSPSELSEGSVSVTSAYSSGSALRESPAYSPEAEGAMDVCRGPAPERITGWYLQENGCSPPGLPQAPLFLMDCEEGGAVGGPQADLEPELLSYGENVENEDYLPTTDVLQVSRGGGRPGSPPAEAS